MAPAQKNKVILPKACIKIWITPPSWPIDDSMATPKMM